MQKQSPSKTTEANYTGQTISIAPDTSDAGETGVFLKENYLISSKPPFTINTLQIQEGGEEEKVDDEAIKILEDKTYQAVLTPLG